MLTERLFDSREEMIEAVQKECLAALEKAIEERGEASFMVSGGSSPETLYRSVSEVDLAWDSVYVALVDERWVDFDLDNSNEGFIVSTLIENNAASANLAGMTDTAEPAFEGL